MLQGETIGLPGNSKGKIIRHLGLVYRPSSVQVEIKASEKKHSSAVKEDRKERMMVGYHWAPALSDASTSCSNNVTQQFSSLLLQITYSIIPPHITPAVFPRQLLLLFPIWRHSWLVDWHLEPFCVGWSNEEIIVFSLIFCFTDLRSEINHPHNVQYHTWFHKQRLESW